MACELKTTKIHCDYIHIFVELSRKTSCESYAIFKRLLVYTRYHKYIYTKYYIYMYMDVQIYDIYKVSHNPNQSKLFLEIFAIPLNLVKSEATNISVHLSSPTHWVTGAKTRATDRWIAISWYCLVTATCLANNTCLDMPCARFYRFSSEEFVEFHGHILGDDCKGCEKDVKKQTNIQKMQQVQGTSSLDTSYRSTGRCNRVY